MLIVVSLFIVGCTQVPKEGEKISLEDEDGNVVGEAIYKGGKFLAIFGPYTSPKYVQKDTTQPTQDYITLRIKKKSEWEGLAQDALKQELESKLKTGHLFSTEEGAPEFSDMPNCGGCFLLRFNNYK